MRALRLRFVDATIVTLSAKLLHFGLWARNRNPDQARRQVKTVLELTWDVLPNFLHLCTDKSENDGGVALGATMRAHMQPGDPWIFDKGCDARDRLLSLHQAGAFFLTPLHTQKVRCDRVLLETDPSACPSAPPQTGQAHFFVTRVIEGVFENSQKTPKTRQKMGGYAVDLDRRPSLRSTHQDLEAVNFDDQLAPLYRWAAGRRRHIC